MFWFFGCKACGILAPWPGIEPAPPALEGGVLTAGPPGKSLCVPLKKKNQNTKKTPSAPNNPYAKETYFGVACSVSVTWMYPNLLMLSSTEGHTDFFMFLAIMNGGAADIVYQNSCLNGGRAIVGSWGETCLVLGKNCQTVFWSSCICVPSAKRESSYFSSPSSNQFCHFFGVYQF